MNNKMINRTLAGYLHLNYLNWIAMAVGLSMILIYNFTRLGTLYVATPDGDLYLSVADNFWETGHFIQSARPYEKDMVVPFGLTAILSVLRIVFRENLGIMIVQYLIFTATGFLIGRVITQLFEESIKQKKLAAWGGKIGVAGSFLYWLNKDILRYANPANIMTEVWTSFFIALFLYLLFCRNSIPARMAVAFVIFVIRPAFYPFLIYSLAEICTALAKRKLSGREKQQILRIVITSVILLTVNIFNNYRETGEFVFLENYAGIAIYEANNPSAKTDVYHSGRTKEFVSEEDTQFWNTFNDTTLSCGQKNAIYKSIAGEYMRTHTMQVLQNAWERITDLFWDRWGAWAKISMAAFILAGIMKHRIFWIGLVFLLISVTTGFGLNIARYSVFIFLYYIISIFWLVSVFVNRLPFTERQGEKV